MTTVVVSPYKVASFLQGGGHFWVYMQYVLGLRQLGCQVYWLEQLQPGAESAQGKEALKIFASRMRTFGLQDRFILYSTIPNSDQLSFHGSAADQAKSIFRQADLLLNFHYAAKPQILHLFRRTALIDIDPGLLQFWISHSQLSVQPHDLYFTIGETVGTKRALFPDCGLVWLHTRPVVNLDAWPFHFLPDAPAFTSVSTWATDSWIVDESVAYENSKRITYRQFAELPRHTSQELELALYLIEKDDAERKWMESLGWHIRLSTEVAGDPEQYRAYIQRSRGEFSVAKPAYISFQTAWVSDRSLCYLASGKPVVVQNTGPSTYLPDGEGLFRFSTLGQAAAAIEAINQAYPEHCQAARQIAHDYFDSRKVLQDLLERSLR